MLRVKSEVKIQSEVRKLNSEIRWREGLGKETKDYKRQQGKCTSKIFREFMRMC